MPIVVDIDVMLAKRKMSVGELADRVGITPANLAVLKNGRAKAVRFTTLAALCGARVPARRPAALGGRRRRGRMRSEPSGCRMRAPRLVAEVEGGKRRRSRSC
jgi:putative transcriptional regulator